MSLNIVSKKVGGGDDSWLGSRHGLDNAETGTLNASAFTGTEVLSGTPVVKSGGLLVPAGGAAPQGFVIGDHSLAGGNTAVPVLWHGRIKADNLPVENFVVPAEPGAFVYVGGTTSGEGA